MNGQENCKILTRQELIPTRRGTPGWFGPKDQQNKTDKFLSVSGAMYVLVNSKKGNGKALKEHILKGIVPLGFDTRIEEIQVQHQQAIKEKDAMIALINDDLQDRNNQIQTIKYDNVALQAQRDVLRTSYKNVKTSLPILRHVMFLMQKIQAKTTLL